MNQSCDLCSNYKMLFDEMLDGLALHEMLYDKDGRAFDYRFLAINPAFEKITGLNANSIIGKTVLEVLPNTEKYWIENYAKVAQTGESFEFENFSQELQKYYEVKAYSPLKDHFITVVKEITLQKQIEEEKKQIQKQLLMTAKLASVGELAAGIGHEINNPLTSISGNLDMIKEHLISLGSDDSRINKILENQEIACDRIAKIVQGLRTYVRSDSDIIETLDLNELTVKTIDFLKVIYQKEGINLSFTTHNERLFFDGNSGKFQQVLINLLSNAKDAILNQKNKNITIETLPLKDHCVLRISDSGIGISVENQSRIFDTFFTTKPTGQGTGLGLSIVKNIIESIGGKIHFSSTIGIGTTFTISIPKSNKKLELPKDESIELTLKKINKKILIVDDEEDIREILRNYFSDLGLDIFEAASGQTALEIFQTEKIDFVVTDLTMPGMNGKELIRKISKDHKFQGKIFVTTGVIAPSLDDLPVSGVLNRPFNRKLAHKLLIESM